MTPEFDHYKNDNLTKVLSKISLLPEKYQFSLLEELDFEDSKLLANFISTTNIHLLDLAFSLSSAKKHWFNQSNSGFFISMALAQPNNIALLEVLFKHSYPIFTHDPQDKKVGVINLIQSLSAFFQDNPDDIDKVMPLLDKTFRQEPYFSALKENIISVLNQTLIARNTEPLFKKLVALHSNAVEYQDKHLIALAKKYPQECLKHLGETFFLHLKDIHPLKENYYSIIKAILEVVPLEKPEISRQFVGVLSLALSFGVNKPVYLKALVNLGVVVPVFDLAPRYLCRKNFCVNLFDNYIQPFWDKFTISHHLKTINYLSTLGINSTIIQQKYSQVIHKMVSPCSFSEQQICDLIKNNNQRQLESLLLKSHNDVHFKAVSSQKLL